jgi:phage tail-like protein
MPRVYSQWDENEFVMRFLAALEEVLDPIIATLDSLPFQFDPAYARADMLDVLAAWLGAAVDESQSTAQRRQLVGQAADLGRMRGTVRGLETMLALSFPDLPLRVHDSGGVSWGNGVDERPRDDTSFVVHCDDHVDDETALAIARIVWAMIPVNALYHLRRPPSGPGDVDPGSEA